MTMQLVRVLSVLLLVKMTMSFECDFDAEAFRAAEQQELAAVQMRYDVNISENSRLNNHFFCINRTTVVDNETGSVEVTFSEFEQDSNRVWTLFFQLPALAYLDPARKIALLNIVLNTLNLPDAGPPNMAGVVQNLDDLCIGTFEFYGLTTFQESVLFHLYHREAEELFGASLLSSQFEANVITAAQDSENDYVIYYPGQSGIIAFNLSAMMLEQDEILLPLRTTQDGADPTTLAVFLGSFGSNMTIADLQESESINDDMFAENPNPVNYGLEAGDIVFAIFGGILLTIVAFLIILGYCIHPFWLA